VNPGQPGTAARALSLEAPDRQFGQLDVLTEIAVADPVAARDRRRGSPIKLKTGKYAFEGQVESNYCAAHESVMFGFFIAQ
jgi:hypothetical protein